jgi:mono/diheme cytochrome c family protein
MHRLESRRRRAALISLGLVTAASVGTLRTLSVAEAHATPIGDEQAAAAKSTTARKPAPAKTTARTTAKTAAKPAAKPAATVAAAAAAPAASPAQGTDGKQVYSTTCAACHQATGQGVEGVYPPLAGSEWVTGDAGKLVRIVLHGLTGPVEVAGETYSGAMPPWGGVLKDVDIASVATYLRSSWGNKASAVTAAEVAKIRTATKARTTPWTAPELTAMPVAK